MGRAPCCDKSKVKRGPWSPEEDATLKAYLENHGTAGNWIGLPQKAGLKRCGKSCRLRWLNYLRPDIKHGPFTEDEDLIIFSLYNKIGSRWSVIASKLQGRTDNDVKNHWNTKLKKKILMATTNATTNPTTSTFISINNLYSTTNFNDTTPLLDQSTPKLEPYYPEYLSGSIAEGSGISDSSCSVVMNNNETINDGPFSDFGFGNYYSNNYDHVGGIWSQEMSVLKGVNYGYGTSYGDVVMNNVDDTKPVVVCENVINPY